MAVLATATAPGCTRPGRSRTGNTRPRFDRCSAHRVRLERPYRPRSRPVFSLPLRQVASDPSVPVEGGSANDYDYADGDPINGLDLSGEISQKRLKRRALAWLARQRRPLSERCEGASYIDGISDACYRYRLAKVTGRPELLTAPDPMKALNDFKGDILSRNAPRVGEKALAFIGGCGTGVLLANTSGQPFLVLARFVPSVAPYSNLIACVGVGMLAVGGVEVQT